MVNTSYAVTEQYQFASLEKREQFAVITKEIRCIVCQNQSLAESDAPLANDLRAKIHDMVNNNKSETDIKNYLVKRYGEYILFKPRLSKISFFLWIFPGIALGIGFYFLIQSVRPK